MNFFSTNMDDIADVIIRPARHFYKLSDLGSKYLTIDEQTVERKDFDVKNNQGLTLKCSLFEKELPNRSEDILIYLHCNSGCRLEGKR
jgi:hypothetical protein